MAQGKFTPGDLGAMPYVVQNVLRYVPPETLRPGDMLATNDAYLGGGHFPDIFLVAPIFEGETLLGYAVNAAHHVDMGGAQPGSEAVQGVRGAFAEGLRILPIRLVKGGNFDDDVLRLILGNVRTRRRCAATCWRNATPTTWARSASAACVPSMAPRCSGRRSRRSSTDPRRGAAS